ncbi:peptidoglycan-binding domain-containing protein [Microbacterium sp. No. 7]|uniref:peptidoglycan-binding domain-containing protein n=1 Tax=Microbacterium sp. No. 7 TaxID=1714373 RepID=UPI0006D051CA|nr:peptidoglycan-binding domain-containing protein [Microbacterium sp. No. 7]ALJ18687.1 hypothetical protein AOA12_01655 [Microbacterium sp. No. 7]
MRAFSRWTAGALVVLAVCAAGVAVGAWLFAPVVPGQLASSDAVGGTAPVTSRTVDDRRTVELVLEVETPLPLLSPASGTVTATTCGPGAALTSGESSLSVDGARIVSLATSVPLWRDLTITDRGDDVAALQTELSRLGYPVTADGVMGPVTLASAADLLGLTGASAREYATIRAASFLWLPAPSVAVRTCEAGLTSRVDAGSALYTLDDALTSARIATVPTDAVPGPRVLVLDDRTIAVDEEGEVAGDEARAALQATRTFATWRDASDRTQPLTAAYVLAAQVEASSLPPSAVYGLDGAAGCVRTDAGVRAVSVVSSQLGQTLVTFDDGEPAPASVVVSPAEELPCR